MTPARSYRRSLRARAIRGALDGVLHGAAGVGRLLPDARRRLRAVECVRGVRYGTDAAEQVLDVWWNRGTQRPAPALVYVHGGGFAIGSRDTHWSLAVDQASHGFVVFNIDYRLAPTHPYPAGLHDALRALMWVQDHAAEYGADPDRIVVAGESAGGNLTLALAVATAYPCADPVAAEVFDRQLTLRAIAPACAVLQVSDQARFRRADSTIPAIIDDRLAAMERAYLGATGVPAGTLPLADPLVMIERDAPARPLPPCFAVCGERDPLLPDTLRLADALAARGTPHQVKTYPGEHHAFHAIPWREAARDARRLHRRFMLEHVPGLTPP